MTSLNGMLTVSPVGHWLSSSRSTVAAEDAVLRVTGAPRRRQTVLQTSHATQRKLGHVAVCSELGGVALQGTVPNSPHLERPECRYKEDIAMHRSLLVPHAQEVLDQDSAERPVDSPHATGRLRSENSQSITKGALVGQPTKSVVFFIENSFTEARTVEKVPELQPGWNTQASIDLTGDSQAEGQA